MTAIVLDTETTGLSPDNDRIIEIAILPWDGSDAFLIHERINPGVPIPPKITEITGIDDSMVRDCPRFEQFAMRICEIVTASDAILGYNPAFDKSMIAAELKRCGYAPTWPLLVDAKRVWDIYEPREKRDLQNAYKRFVSGDGFDGAHGARRDTWATRETLRAQIDAFGLHDVPWDQLDPERALWWGPSNHVIVVDSILVMNFGKHESRPCDEVDVGFWRWLSSKDFPDHMTLLALKCIELSRTHRGEQLRRAISDWGMAYKEKMT
jgi:DNA polymerase III epsilon subunit-like protein